MALSYCVSYSKAQLFEKASSGLCCAFRLTAVSSHISITNSLFIGVNVYNRLKTLKNRGIFRPMQIFTEIEENTQKTAVFRQLSAVPAMPALSFNHRSKIENNAFTHGNHQPYQQ